MSIYDIENELEELEGLILDVKWMIAHGEFYDDTIPNEDYLMSLYERKEELRDRLRFAWADDEEEMNWRLDSGEFEYPCDLYGLCPYDEHCEYHCYGNMY